MRRFSILLLAMALLFRIAPAMCADPLTGRGGASAGSESVTTGGSMVLRFASVQHQLNDRISAAFRAIRDGEAGKAWLVILGLAFLYGVLHAIGPGHGKAVVASYFVANRARWTSGVLMGSMISLIQGASAVILVGLLAIVLQWRQFDVLNRSTLVEFVSYGLIVLLGAIMFFRAITGRGCAHAAAGDHDHAHDHHDHLGGHDHGHGAVALDRKLIVATGLTPCASAIIILLFALANNALGVGIAAVSALSVGMAITVSAIGAVSVLGRQAILRVVDGVGIASHRLEQGLAVVGALAIVGASGLMMFDAWTRL